MIAERLITLNLAEPVAIIGAGVTGQSCFALLQLAGVACQVFDESEQVPDSFAEQRHKVTLGTFTTTTFTDYPTVLLSPGIDTRRDCFAKHNGSLLTDIELFARLTDKPIIGVTGSNGKSTVVSLLHQVTQYANRKYVLCGNIGLPVLQALAENDDRCEGYIVELSSYHLERAPSLSCDIGVWLNVSPDHLDRYDCYEDYVATKARLFAQSKHLIVNADDVQVNTFAGHYINDDNKHLVYFSQTCERDWYCKDGNIYYQYADEALFDLQDFRQIGNHHADNLMAVFAAAQLLDIDAQTTAEACKQFKPLPSRAVVVGRKNGVTFINDSKGTNIGATVAAINGIEQPMVLIAGGQGKGQDFAPLIQAAQGRVKCMVLIGEDAGRIRQAVAGTIPTQLAEDLPAAVAAAIAAAGAGDVVILSPACASFDMFSNYLKRGEAFEGLVKEWINE